MVELQTRTVCVLGHVQLIEPPGLYPARLLCPWSFERRRAGGEGDDGIR